MKIVLPLLLFPTLALSNDAGDWLAPFKHVHESPAGTPVVHAFNIEPAITGRDLFVTGRYRSSDEAVEREIEMELEWALTQRLGVILELPYIVEDEKGGGPRSDGFGNLAVVPRALLYVSDRFMLTGQVEFELPTASHDFESETAMAPGFAAWFDLGGWWTLNSQVGVEHNFDEDANELVYGFGLVKTFGGEHRGHHHEHASAGGLNLHFELTGSTGLSGDEDGDTSMEGLIGVSYGLCNGLDIRAGYEFPIKPSDDFDHGWVAGCVWHF